MAGRLYTHWHPIPESDLHRPSLGSELFVHVLQNELLGPGAKPKARAEARWKELELRK